MPRTDAELVLQEFRGIDRIAPLIHLDEAAIRCAGGRQHVLTAPCAVGPAPDGLLLEVAADPWRAERDARLQRAAAVARHPGIRPGSPLALVETRVRILLTVSEQSAQALSSRLSNGPAST